LASKFEKSKYKQQNHKTKTIRAFVVKKNINYQSVSIYTSTIKKTLTINR